MVIEKVLYPSESDIIPALRDRTDAAMCVLVLIKALFYERSIKASDDSVYCWYHQEMNRFFWGNEKNSIHSIRAPFILRIEDRFEILSPIIHGQLKYEYITELYSLFQSIKDNSEGVIDSIEWLDNEFSDMLQQHQVTDRHDIESLWCLFWILCTFEPGYLRYDYDPKRECGQIHPLYHLDINYSKQGTYKIGLKHNLNINNFINLLLLSSECGYLDEL